MTSKKRVDESIPAVLRRRYKSFKEDGYNEQALGVLERAAKEIERLTADVQELTCGDPRKVCPNCRDRSPVETNGDETTTVKRYRVVSVSREGFAELWDEKDETYDPGCDDEFVSSNDYEQLQAENKNLRRDAERYRVVRVSRLTGEVLAHELDAACDNLVAACSAEEPAPHRFKPGDRVSIPETGTSGTVLTVGSERAQVQYDHGPVRDPLLSIQRPEKASARRVDAYTVDALCGCIRLVTDGSVSKFCDHGHPWRLSEKSP